MRFQTMRFKCVVRMIVLVVASCVALSNAEDKPNRVVIRNNLDVKNNKNLKVHCRTSEKDLGVQIVRPLQVFEYSVSDSFFHMTSIWCNVWQGPNYKHHQEFRAYKTKTYKTSDDLYFWDAREDGIYFTDNIDAVAEFKYAWDAPH